MKKLKKLSLENEMKKEAEQIEKKVREDKSLDDIKVSDEMEKELFNKIQDYEYDKRHKKVVRKKKKSKLVIGALAAVLILVCGSVMTSVGSKSYWKTFCGNEKMGMRTLILSDVENMESIETEDIDEVGVYKEIAKVMGDYLVRIEYKPEDMALKKYSVDQNQRRANLFYQNGKEIIRYSMYMNSKDSSLGQKTVDNLVDEYEVENKGRQIRVEEYEVRKTKEKRYIAEFEYKGVQYQLKGIMEKEEFDKIIKNLFFM
ncbi:MAG: DUF4367 domain-containing protein [Mediterraneibacter faecis]